MNKESYNGFWAALEKEWDGEEPIEQTAERVYPKVSLPEDRIAALRESLPMNGARIVCELRLQLFYNCVCSLGGVWANERSDMYTTLQKGGVPFSYLAAMWPSHKNPVKTVYLTDGPDIVERFKKERVEGEKNICESLPGVYVDMNLDGKWMQKGDAYAIKVNGTWDLCNLYKCQQLWVSPISKKLCVVPVNGSIVDAENCFKVVFRKNERRTVHLSTAATQRITQRCVIPGSDPYMAEVLFSNNWRVFLMARQYNDKHVIQATLYENGKVICEDAVSTTTGSASIRFKHEDCNGITRSVTVMAVVDE